MNELIITMREADLSVRFSSFIGDFDSAIAEIRQLSQKRWDASSKGWLVPYSQAPLLALLCQSHGYIVKWIDARPKQVTLFT